MTRAHQNDNNDIVIWQSPDYRPGPEYPRFAHDWHLMVEQAAIGLNRRRDAYPEMIRKGEMTADAARADLAAWELIHGEWRWIASVGDEGTQPGPETIPARYAAVELALERVETAIARQGPRPALVHQQHVLEAMEWHLLRFAYGQPAVHRTVHLTRYWRDQIASDRPLTPGMEGTARTLAGSSNQNGAAAAPGMEGVSPNISGAANQ